jgi:hypothetical protein
MRLRICDGERERTSPASIELIEEAFAPATPIREGSEIALADGERWIAAVAVGQGTKEQFLLSGATGQSDPPSGRVARSEALRRFREFLLESVEA